MNRILKLVVLVFFLTVTLAWADSLVTSMTEDTTPATTDLVYEVKNPGTTPVDRKVQIGNLPFVKKADVIKLVSFYWDGGGSAVTTGATTKRCAQVPHAATITGCFIKASTSSTLTLTPYKDAFSTSALATTALISGAGTTGVTGTLGLNDETLTNWTTAITAKDEICAQVTTNDNALWIEFQIYGHR